MKRFVLVWLLVAGCSAPAAVATPTAAPPTGTPQPPPGIHATLWHLVQIGGQATAADGPTAAGIEFGDSDKPDDVRGSGPCGELLGSYHVDGASITVTVRSTKVNECDAAGLKARQDYLAALAGATTWKRDGSRLTLSGTTELVFENLANHL